MGGWPAPGRVSHGELQLDWISTGNVCDQIVGDQAAALCRHQLCGLVVSAQVSFIERKQAPRSDTAAMTFRRSRVERASRSSASPPRRQAPGGSLRPRHGPSWRPRPSPDSSLAQPAAVSSRHYSREANPSNEVAVRADALCPLPFQLRTRPPILISFVELRTGADTNRYGTVYPPLRAALGPAASFNLGAFSVGAPT